MAHLVKVRHLQVGALSHTTRIGLQLAQNELEQRRLARTVGANQPHLVAAQNRAGEVAHDDLVAERLGHVFQFGHDLAAGGA